MAESWRIEEGAQDFLRNQQKRQAIDQRRPVPRKASDLVGMGPGIGGSAVKVSNWDDALAIFDGYFSSWAGALNAPNSVENFVGHTIMDEDFGGLQTVVGMASDIEYRRTFRRNPSDQSAVSFGVWRSSKTPEFPDTPWINVQYLGSWVDFDGTGVGRTVQYRRYNGELLMRGIMRSGTVPGNAFFLPTEFLPDSRVANDQHFPCVSNDAAGGIAIDATTGVCRVLFGSPVWVDVSGVRFLVTH